jgi:hypothetical protein
MDTMETMDEQPGMRLRAAFLRWASCLGIFAALVSIASAFSAPIFGNLALFFYLGAGIYLNRSVLRRIIEWHPMYNTLDNVTSAKLKFFLLWPILYVFLFVRLGINKVL